MSGVKKNKIEIAPSILAADFCCLEREVKAVQDAGADRIHCDVMDGHFVPNLSFGPMVIAAVKKCVSIPLDVHLMISNPGKYIKTYCDAGADTLTVHAETCDAACIACEIKKYGARAGVTVNPDKGIDLFLPHIEYFDQVLIMTVYAGFGAQKFMPETLAKILDVRDCIDKKKLAIDIEVDGGINPETAKLCASNGANVFVAGSYIFGNGDYRQKIDALRNPIYGI
jgi:ribulose-phosphate 3-epimerase